MLYIFDLGNVIVDIDFNRVLGVWSRYSGVPLAELQRRFVMDDVFFSHERGEISDQQFASALCENMLLPLSYQQFSEGWLAIFGDLRQDVIDIMRQLRDNGHRVVVLSNTNHMHTVYWQQHYPQVAAAADVLYLSQQMGLRKPEPAIYQALLQAEGTSAAQAVFFDDIEQNVQAARQQGITAVQVISNHTVTDYFAAILPDAG